jgi:hypothetical protein
MSTLRNFRPQAKKPPPKLPANSSFASWADRAYFMAGYFSALCAVALILYSVFLEIDPAKDSREHKGWNLELPKKVDGHSLGE